MSVKVHNRKARAVVNQQSRNKDFDVRKKEIEEHKARICLHTDAKDKDRPA